MILVGNQRGGAKDLAQHLLKDENEHVEVHELRGFASDDLTSALNESYAVSKGTRCKQFLFSLSLNPPKDENVKTEDFENAIDRVEDKLGLSGQPRAIVFHEKDGRRHAHAVWSRIDTDEMKAVPLPYTKLELRDVSRDLYMEHGWIMPRGLMNSKARDPKNFTLEEWQQAKRNGKDPREIKTVFQDCWAVSDSRQAFSAALKERGFRLARGDRRGHVAVDRQGEVYAVAKWVGVKTRDVRARLGNENTFPSVAKRKEEFAREVSARLNEIKAEQNRLQAQEQERAERKRKALVERQREARKQLAERQRVRCEKESAERLKRFNKGLRGFIDWVSGQRKKIKDRNEEETEKAALRDRAEKDSLIFKQLEERRNFKKTVSVTRQRQCEQKQEIQTDIQRQEALQRDAREERRAAFMRKRKQAAKREPRRQMGPDRGLGL